MARTPKRISDFDRKLGAAIKNRRTDPDYGMPQTRLAALTGIPLSNLQRREDGVNEVTVSELERIAHHLQTTPAALVEDALARYGGMEKLLAEYATSEPAPTVDDLATRREEKFLGSDFDEKRFKSAAVRDAELDGDEPHTT